MPITILGRIRRTETIAAGRGIRDLERLTRSYGPGWWRKRKGIARVMLDSGLVITAEIHWYEAFGIGRREIKVKRVLVD